MAQSVESNLPRPAPQPRVSLPDEELMSSGHYACPGCAATLLARTFLRLAGHKTVMVVPACCFSVIDGPFPYSAMGVPLVHCAFETAAITAAGVKAGLKARGDGETLVVAWAGDGGTFDIGIQSLSGAAERNEDILYVCYDNEAYMNTGVQRSGATPGGAWTTTTPAGKGERKKDLGMIIAAHRVPYFATVSTGYQEDMVAKMKRAIRTRGFRLLHAISPCPPGWKMEERDAVKAARLAVDTRIFPLYEVEDGLRWRLTVDPTPQPVAEYTKLQGRFGHFDAEAVTKLQRAVDADWKELSKRCVELPSNSGLRI